jgi:hypothetical protein
LGDQAQGLLLAAAADQNRRDRTTSCSARCAISIVPSGAKFDIT